MVPGVRLVNALDTPSEVVVTFAEYVPVCFEVVLTTAPPLAVQWFRVPASKPGFVVM